ncbi:TRAP transporter small permease [Succinatimonas hippei]|uniref:TRAP transporter small permease n=1 Tax=Succinatimonas hippei TaxID=626938 RepID=UPI002013938D|nr:TRAP transporter small permease [Succinatimonas hippei]MCL1603361.1 TRAP transporter small permease [Succinatimonas hippei]
MDTIKFLRSAMNKVLFWINTILIVVLVLDVSWQVLSRYVASSPSTFTDELARYLMVWMGFLGGAYMFGSNSHLSVTSLRDKLPEKLKNIVILCTYLLIIAFTVLVMIYGSQRLILRTLAQPSPSLGIPMGAFYSILPISAFCIIYYMILHIIELFISKKN